MRGGGYGIGRDAAVERDVGDRVQTCAGEGDGSTGGATGRGEANRARSGGSLPVHFAAQHPRKVVGQGAKEVIAGVVLDLFDGGYKGGPGAAARRISVRNFQGDDTNRVGVGVGNAAERGAAAQRNHDGNLPGVRSNADQTRSERFSGPEIVRAAHNQQLIAVGFHERIAAVAFEGVPNVSVLRGRLGDHVGH